MTDALDASNPFAQQLEAFTSAEPGTELWREALRASGKSKASRPSTSLGNYVIPNRFLLSFVAVVFLVLTAGILLPSLGRARSTARSPVVSASPAMKTESLAFDSPLQYSVMAPSPSKPAEELRGIVADNSTKGESVVNTMVADEGAKALINRLLPAAPADPRLAAPSPTLTRHVVRKATIDLAIPTSNDSTGGEVRATASKIAFLINEPEGEYVESSNIYGQNQYATAQLTIRVVATRLSEVLNKIRELGTVATETSDGRDVTEQVIDVEARLRNELSVEQELLKLLASRESAPLTEILQLREQINASRDRIERLTAQRDGLYRLTTLATILITIRADNATTPIEPTSWWSSLSHNLSNAGESGLRTLSSALAFLLWIAIAGLPWWILLAALTLIIRRARKATLAKRATEPPPGV